MSQQQPKISWLTICCSPGYVGQVRTIKILGALPMIDVRFLTTILRSCAYSNLNLIG